MDGGGGAAPDHGREPCPDRIIDDVGGAFGMGAVGGGLWHLVKGIKNSPTGGRLLGGVQVRVPPGVRPTFRRRRRCLRAGRQPRLVELRNCLTPHLALLRRSYMHRVSVIALQIESWRQAGGRVSIGPTRVDLRVCCMPMPATPY